MDYFKRCKLFFLEELLTQLNNLVGKVNLVYILEITRIDQCDKVHSNLIF